MIFVLFILIKKRYNDFMLSIPNCLETKFVTMLVDNKINFEKLKDYHDYLYDRFYNIFQSFSYCCEFENIDHQYIIFMNNVIKLLRKQLIEKSGSIIYWK